MRKWKWLIVFVLLIILPIPTPVLADTSQGVVVTATGYIGGAPVGLTLTYVNDFEIGISWTKGDPAPEPLGTITTVINTLVRVRWGAIPADRDDGYQVYYGDANTFTDDSVDLTSLTQMPYYRAWSETAFYDIDGNIISSTWEETGIWEEANFMSISWLFAVLGILALGLTYALFSTKNAMLGFPAAIFWALFGGHNWTLSTATWDIHYMIGFASLLGMVTFTALGAYGLREKRDAIGEQEVERGEGGYIDEGGGVDDTTFHSGEKSSKKKRKKEEDEDEFGMDTEDMFDMGENAPPSARTVALRERAAARRGRAAKQREQTIS